MTAVKLQENGLLIDPKEMEDGMPYAQEFEGKTYVFIKIGSIIDVYEVE